MKKKLEQWLELSSYTNDIVCESKIYNNKNYKQLKKIDYETEHSFLKSISTNGQDKHV